MGAEILYLVRQLSVVVVGHSQLYDARPGDEVISVTGSFERGRVVNANDRVVLIRPT